MCGILGVVPLQAGVEVDRACFAEALQRLAHRGPDGSGILHRERFSFGHRRLSVIELSERGAQPMSAAAGAVHVTYNGEIFNHAELRRELRGAGHDFVGECDTEVLLHAYLRWGSGCLERLDGMFAFGLFDERDDSLLLARDRLGIKPLYWCLAPEALLFASEPAALLCCPGVEAALNPRAVSALLSFRCPPGAETCFAGINRLLPGELLRLEPGRLPQLSRWWRLPPSRPHRRFGRRRRRELGAALAKAVERTLVADVPVSSFLSGGLDSSVVLAEMATASAAPVTTVTASFADPAYDESPAAARTAAAFGARSRIVPIDPGSLLAHARELIRAKGQPLGMHNEVAVNLVAREAARTHKVALSGEGADELFAGYARIFRFPFEHRRARLLAAVPGRLRRLVAPRLAAGPAPGGFVEDFLTRYSYFPRAEKLDLFSGPMRAAVDEDRGLTAPFRESLECDPRASGSARVRRFFLEQHLPGLLQMMDSMCMAAGLELRVPFVDHRLVEAGWRVPPRGLLRRRSPVAALRALRLPVDEISEREDISKYVLRRLYRRRLPAAAPARPKLGFPVPLSEWLSTELGWQVRELLLDPAARSAELIDRAALARWLEDQDPGDPAFGKKLWLLVNLELWLREFFPEGPLLPCSTEAESSGEPQAVL